MSQIPMEEAKYICIDCGTVNYKGTDCKNCKPKKEVSDGTSANYYKLPKDATELQHLIAYKNMNAQLGEIFRATYRYGEVSHSDRLRDLNKIIFYAQAEAERISKYEQ